MKSLDLTKPITTESLLAEFESRFNQTMDLSKLSKEELEDETKIAEYELGGLVVIWKDDHEEEE